jgi:cardiolipin synthase
VKLLPNALSAARLALAPWLFYLLWHRQYGLALIVIFLAGVTDGLDGLLARAFGAASKLGAYLDPVADKVLLSGAFLTLALDGAVAKWLAVLVLGRDALILIFACVAFLFTSVRSFPPSFWGKASTTSQIIYIVVLLAHFTGLLGAIFVTLAEYSAAALTVWSFLHYAWIARRILRVHQTAKS